MTSPTSFDPPDEADLPDQPDLPAEPELPAPELPGEPARPNKNPPSWHAWLAAAVAAAIGIGIGVVVLNRGGDSDAATVAAEQGDDGTSNDSSDPPAGFGGAGFGGGVVGEITAIDGSTLTVERTDPSGSSSTVEVATNDETSVTETVEGNLGDLAVGDSVLVMGEEDDAGVTATSISETPAGAGLGSGFPGGDRDGAQPPEGFDPPDGFQPPDGDADGAPGGGFPGGAFTVGEITAIDGQTITVKSGDGESTSVTVTDSTTVNVSEERSVSDIEVGDTIRATGDTEDSVVMATAIQLGDAGFGRFGPGRPGGPSTTDDATTS